ncbi:hypothetical protein D9M71_588380 [compost metagenome]
MDLVAPVFQVFDHPLAGGELFEAKLRLTMDRPAQLDHGGGDGFDAGGNIGVVHIVLSWFARRHCAARWLARSRDLT